jgi:hypothetical protein
MDRMLSYGFGYQLDEFLTYLLRTDVSNQKPLMCRLIQVGNFNTFIRESVSLKGNLSAAPNGASMRPNSPYQRSLVRSRFRGVDVIVYSVPEGKSFIRNLPDSDTWT